MLSQSRRYGEGFVLANGFRRRRVETGPELPYRSGSGMRVYILRAEMLQSGMIIAWQSLPWSSPGYCEDILG